MAYSRAYSHRSGSPYSLKPRTRLLSLTVASCVVACFFWLATPSHEHASSGRSEASLSQSSPCERCAASGGMCDKYGSRALDVSRAFEGTGQRIRNLLSRALDGEPVVIAVLGGSVSIGHACYCDGQFWNQQVAKWWNDTFPHPDNRFDLAAVGARGSGYFAFCHNEHLPNDVDLVLLEFGTNDGFEMAAAKSFEVLLRGVLEYPNSPAALIVDSFKLKNGPFASGSDAHAGVAAYYDIPNIETRALVLPSMLQNYSRVPAYFVEWYNHDRAGVGREPPTDWDLLHPNLAGHTLMADMAIAYLEQQLCYVKQERKKQLLLASRNEEERVVKSRWDVSGLTIPRQLLSEKFDPDPTSRTKSIKPGCLSVDGIRPFKPIKSKTHGFTYWTDPQHSDKSYWHATEVGATIAFEFETVAGKLVLTWLRSSKLGLGKLDCWVDDERDRSYRCWGWWGLPTSVASHETLRDDLKPGKHILTCQVYQHPLDYHGPDVGSRFDIIGLMYV